MTAVKKNKIYMYKNAQINIDEKFYAFFQLNSNSIEQAGKGRE